MLRASDNDPALKLLKESGVPLVVSGRLKDSSIAQVDEDNFGTCMDFAKKILQRGYRRPALILGDTSFNVNRARREGYLAAVKIAGLAGNEKIFADTNTEEELAKVWEKIKKSEIDCIFCGDDALCLKLLGLMKGYDKIKVSSFYYSDLLAGTDTEAPSFNARELGKKSAELLLNLINT